MERLVLSGLFHQINVDLMLALLIMNGVKGINVDDVDNYLSSGNYDVLATVHNETSTGVMSNLENISKLLKSKYPEVIWLEML